MRLLCVSKTYGPETVRQAYQAGERCFGENYVQEGLDKIVALADLRNSLEWHLIGPLQSNKTRAVAENFDWVHSVDRERIARRLAEQRPRQLGPLQVCLQVNIDDEASKSGCSLAEAPTLARLIAQLPGLRLRGLMAIPQPQADAQRMREPFGRLRELFERMRADGLPVDTLSMGMSDDLEAAIAEGSTMVRVGSALFGRRERSAA